jgi:hypothetical protein
MCPRPATARGQSRKGSAVRALSRIKKRGAAWRRLSFTEQWIIVNSLVLLPSIAVANRVFGFNRVHRFLQTTSHRSARRRAGTDTAVGVRRVTSLVESTARLVPWQPNCLHRSMTLWWVLRRRGVESAIRFGVQPRSPSGRPAFHAWIECDGVVLNDDLDVATRFLPFDGPIVGGSWG